MKAGVFFSKDAIKQLKLVWYFGVGGATILELQTPQNKIVFATACCWEMFLCFCVLDYHHCSVYIFEHL